VSHPDESLQNGPRFLQSSSRTLLGTLFVRESLPILAFRGYTPVNRLRGLTVEFFEFDEQYLNRLRIGDPATVAHFFAYFDRLLRMLLRARRLSPDRVEDLTQETFRRVLEKLRCEGSIREPDKFGSFVNSICKYALLENERVGKRDGPLEDAHLEVPDKVPDAHSVLEAREARDRVRQVLAKMPQKDRDLLREIFFLEKDKDEICRERGVDREYLRVLVHRAKTRFRIDFEAK
jgi:RNA polymerase sigma-70 factor (ECF subfamily)